MKSHMKIGVLVVGALAFSLALKWLFITPLVLRFSYSDEQGLGNFDSALIIFLSVSDALMAGLVVLLLMRWLRRAFLAPIAALIDVLQSNVPAEEVAGLLAQSQEASELGRMRHAVGGVIGQLESERRHAVEQMHFLEEARDNEQGLRRELVLSEKLAVVGEMSASVGHELGNPLTAIGGFVDMWLRRGGGNEAIISVNAQELKTVGAEISRMQEILTTLVRNVHVREGVKGECVAAEVAKHVVNSLKMHPKTEGIILEIVEDEEAKRLPITFGAATQVLMNLVLNACDAAAGGAKSPRVVIVCGAGIQVHDNGGGLDADAKAALFQFGFTTKSLVPARRSGSGLGLAICKWIIDASGGALSAEDSHLGGLVVRITW